MYFNRDGQVAGLEELAARPDLITAPTTPMNSTSSDAEQRNEMEIGAGALVGALIDELVKNVETYIRLENPEQDGYTCNYTLVQGKQEFISPIGIALGFKSVTDSKLEAHNA
jgi:hypothetical protein